MRRGLAALALALALPAMAERYGPITITSLPDLGAPDYGEYYEYRFRIDNRSNASHEVRIEVRSESHGTGADATARRTFTVAPRSLIIAHVPQLLTTSYTAARAHVVIDGDSERRPIALKEQPTWEGDQQGQMLGGRSVPVDALRSVALHRPELAPSEWSTSWLQYARFRAALFTAQDWTELPPPARAALLQWTSAGGWLLFLGQPEGLPALRPATASDRWGFHGLGRISVAPAGVPLEPELQRDIATWARASGNERSNPMRSDLPLLEGRRLPVRSLFSVLLAFAVIGGPVNLFVLAKKNRRVWVFWTLPVLAVATSIVLVGATLLDEGWVRIQRSRSFTLLDENRGEATTIGVTGIYATMAPRGEVLFDHATQLRGGWGVRSAETDWDDGQRLFGSFVAARVPTYFAVRRTEPRRERLPLRADARGIVAVNGLGAAIDRLWVATADGSILTAKNVAPGSEVVLARDPKLSRVRESVPDIAERFPRLNNWEALVNIGQHDPAALLRPGMYVAVLRDSRFLPVALERPTATSAHGVVIGFQKGAGDAR